jgi:microcystin-dependent protein
MASPYVGEIILVAFNFAPAGWALCDGSLLPISENETLFQLIGTTFGGDGESTFAVPDLRGRVAVGLGVGPGLSNNYILGELAGTESIILTAMQMPIHTHAITGQTAVNQGCRNGPANSRFPVGNVPAVEAAGSTMTYSSDAPNVNMNPAAIAAPPINSGATGGTTAHTNMQPFLTLNYCISLFGIFPSPT